MSTEPLTTTTTPDPAAERGLLIAVLVMVVLGVGGMLFMA